MKIKNDKPVLFIIIILLLIIAPLALYGTYMSFSTRSDNVSTGNSNNSSNSNNLDLYVDGSLVGTYTCISEGCNYATSSNEDILSDYYIGDNLYLPEIDGKIFISDNNKVLLYDIANSVVLEEYEEIKFYNSNTNTQNIFFAKQNGKWGAVSLVDYEIINIPFEYDSMSVNGIMIDDVLSTEQVLVSKDSKWFLIDGNGNKLTNESNDKVENYTDKYIFLKGDFIEVYDYDGNLVSNEENVIDYTFVDNYIGLIEDNLGIIVNTNGVAIENTLYIYDTNNGFTNNLVAEIDISGYNDIRLEMTDVLEIYINDILFTSLDVN